MGLPYEQRLCRSYQFNQVFTHGKRRANRLMILYSMENQGQGRRLGLAISKRVGKAVTRNRVRRRIQEAWRGLAPQLRTDCDVVISGRPSIAKASHHQICTGIEELLTRVGMLDE